MKNIFYLCFIFLLSYHLMANELNRLKDIIYVKGVRSNPLIGYGLVIGLNGTGDGGGEITNSSLKRMFQKLGLNPQNELSSKNVAAVIVTAKLPPFSRVGQKIDVIVSSIGDSSSLAGGTLLITPLKGGDGSIFALANGPLSIGGLEQGSNYPTTARIPNGATVEKEIEFNFRHKKSIRLSLNKSDFTTAFRIQKKINTELGGKYALAQDSNTVDLIIPVHYQRKVVELIALIENFEIETDRKTSIVINERTGTVVTGGDIKLKEVAISHGDLSIEIKGGGNNEGSEQKFFTIPEATSVNDLVKALGGLGVSAEDLISIFQALKQNGALIGEIEVI